MSESDSDIFIEVQSTAINSCH